MPLNSWYHRIDRFTFQFWQGDCPEAPTQQLETYQRAGVEGAGFRLLGARGVPLDVTLTEHLTAYILGAPLVRQYQSLIGLAPVEVWWNQQRLLPLLQTKFAVLDVTEVECQVNVRLLGPGYNLPGGAALVTRWKLLPIAV
jgi:hypothetical protein